MNNRLLQQLALLLPASALCASEPITLSMDQAIAEALERNFSIRIERIGPQIAEQDVRAASGAFDPVLNSEYNYELRELGESPIDDESAYFRFGVGSTLPWGTQWQASIETSDRTSPLDPLLPPAYDSISSFAGIVVTQPILRNFGLDGTWSGVRIARESSAAAWELFRGRVMDIVTDTVRAYQNVYFAEETLRIALRNRDLALQLLKDNRKRVETGSMAPLDLVQAESEAALREVSVISARALLRQSRNALKALVWDEGETVLDLELSITPPAEPEQFEPLPERDFQLALANRPEYLAALAGLNIRQFELRQLKRNALPQLDLVGSAGRVGISRDFDDSLETALSDGDAAYSIGAVFSLPFPNRTRSAERTQAYLRRNQAELGLRQLEQQIRLQLDDAGTQLKADWERIKAARTARELAEKSLQAEEKKLKAGTSSTFVVLRLQGDLANAEIRETNAIADYSTSLAVYDRVRGRILDSYNIHLYKGEDASR
jgi:outer membrane protein TolC